MSQLRQQQAVFDQHHVATCVVTYDAPGRAEAYVRDTGLPWPLLLDPTRQLYREYGMGHIRWTRIYHPVSIGRYLQLVIHQGRLYRPGKDQRQAGGDVLIDPQGIVRVHHIEKTPHDRLPIQTLLGAFL